VGLFKRGNNVTINNIKISSANIAGKTYSGILAGRLDISTISNSYVTGTVTGADDYTGGFTG